MCLIPLFVVVASVPRGDRSSGAVASKMKRERICCSALGQLCGRNHAKRQAICHQRKEPVRIHSPREQLCELLCPFISAKSKRFEISHHLYVIATKYSGFRRTHPV